MKDEAVKNAEAIDTSEDAQAAPNTEAEAVIPPKQAPARPVGPYWTMEEY